MNLRAIKRRHDKATTRVAIFRFGRLSVLARFKTADGRTWGFASRITKELFHDATALKLWLESVSGCPEPAVLHVALLGSSVGTSYVLRVFENGAYWTPLLSFLAPLPHEVRR